MNRFFKLLWILFFIASCRSGDWSETYSVTRNGVKCGYTKSSKYVKKFEQARAEWNAERIKNAVPINIDNIWGRWRYPSRSFAKDLYIRITSSGKVYHGVKEYNGTINHSTEKDIIFKNISRLDPEILHTQARWRVKGSKKCESVYIDSMLFLHRNGKLYLLVLNEEGFANDLPSPVEWHRVK